MNRPSPGTAAVIRLSRASEYPYIMHRVPRTPPPGLLAAGPAHLVLLLGPFVLGGPGILEAVSDAVVRATPIVVFEGLLGSLGSAAKWLLFGAVAVGVVLAGGALGWIIGRSLGPPGPGRAGPRRAGSWR